MVISVLRGLMIFCILVCDLGVVFLDFCVLILNILLNVKTLISVK